jgi:spoIIIJ-associated protein
MLHETLIKEMSFFTEALGIHTKEISVTVDSDIHITLISLGVGGNYEKQFTDNNNELLRDLGHVFKLILQKKYSVYKNIIVDVNDCNKKLIEYTKEKASIAVERVKFFDKPYEFGYLNAYERMIIHTYLKKFPHIRSESEGLGKERRLTLRKQ